MRTLFVHFKILYRPIKPSQQFDCKSKYNEYYNYKLQKNIVSKAFVGLITAKFWFISQKSSDKSIHDNYNVTRQQISTRLKQIRQIKMSVRC